MLRAQCRAFQVVWCPIISARVAIASPAQQTPPNTEASCTKFPDRNPRHSARPVYAPLDRAALAGTTPGHATAPVAHHRAPAQSRRFVPRHLQTVPGACRTPGSRIPGRGVSDGSCFTPTAISYPPEQGFSRAARTVRSGPRAPCLTGNNPSKYDSCGAPIIDAPGTSAGAKRCRG